MSVRATLFRSDGPMGARAEKGPWDAEVSAAGMHAIVRAMVHNSGTWRWWQRYAWRIDALDCGRRPFPVHQLFLSPWVRRCLTIAIWSV